MDDADQIKVKREILVYSPGAKDSELTISVLTRAGFVARAVKTATDLVRDFGSAGMVIIASELLTAQNIEIIRNALSAQPPWSDVPIVAISPGENSLSSNEALSRVASALQNITLLERPVRLATLVTVVRAALSSREKQFQLKTILEDLENSKREAENANLAKSSFLANMSHEIRTPLAAVIGFTDLMRNPKLPDEERNHFADIIARNGEQLSSLINDILDLSKIEAGKLEFEHVAFSLPTFIAEMSSLLRPMVEKNRLAFVVEESGHLPSYVMADPNRIRQILINLVSNSAKFTQNGFVRFAVHLEDTPGADLRLVFRIQDTGIGMSETQKIQLFSPFSQADASVTRRFGGTGLGLDLSRRLAQGLGGDLKLVESIPGQGSLFEASVKVQIPDVTALSSPFRALTGDLTGLSILLAEDSLDNQLLLKTYLTSAGARVTTVSNGQDAVAVAVAQKFDVVLMDIQMPVLDGLRATKQLKAIHYAQPIVALTAHAMQEERDRSIEAGCIDHLTKPIRRDTLVAAVLRVCQRTMAM